MAVVPLATNADTIAVQSAEVRVEEDGYFLNAEFELTINSTLEEALQKGVALTTMSTSSTNIRANFDIMDFALSVDEMARIDTLNTVNHRIITRAGGVPWAAEW